MDKSQTRAPHNRLNRRVVNPTASLTQTLYKRRSCLIHRLYYPTRHPLYEWATLRPITSPSPCRSPHHKQHDHFTGGPSKRRRPPKARTIVVENEDEGEDEREDEYNNHKISATRTKVWSRTVFLKTPLPARMLPSFPNKLRTRIYQQQQRKRLRRLTKTRGIGSTRLLRYLRIQDRSLSPLPSPIVTRDLIIFFYLLVR